ncbi:MAG: BsuBI/PstI family type II restriction endonuclease [Limnospira sp. PMC 1291.21]|uniref:BsuBI/PstI family type II restriction endonuclease n=1 Tax=Limnospira TaxID=2596745 RepID=UPI0016589963|nr:MULTISPECIES: BsuBI/PstI family type II restriction endonuclease [Limnospira]MDT9179018.1 BsuBI/PstI family type II restriction endonuclease [Limnospira sp. PMC 1238.20]MDT9194232.1 BsuBI/PstI family type II restriction endonuclease [Limnospira sp. PMC 1245.20]MDT9199565.1 BsuBI/PstI family type II restriction endonuclease [Limnospira sp. PMC 1042.18]MDT9204524.1 BsuBI/PstI family type II restriction endonuclease [Limnospira sp. PMC 1243.20]MDT9209655.1 BsuBI/PstI family type II restriction
MSSNNSTPNLEQLMLEARQLMKDLGLPDKMQADTPIFVLLVMLDMKPAKSWSEANNQKWGITPLMNKMRELGFKNLAPNTRENIRDDCVGQLVDAELATENPDKPRPKNSPKYCYQINQEVLDLVKKIGSADYPIALNNFLSNYQTIKHKYQAKRQSQRLNVKIAHNFSVSIAPGGQGVLIKSVLQDFCKYFNIDKVLYIDNTVDTARGYSPFIDEDLINDLGIDLDKFKNSYDKPDIVLYKSDKKYLIIIEAVKTGGAINVERRDRLLSLFENVDVKLSFVNAFESFNELKRLTKEITWETHAWIMEFPDHMIHFNGDQYLFH